MRLINLVYFNYARELCCQEMMETECIATILKRFRFVANAIVNLFHFKWYDRATHAQQVHLERSIRNQIELKNRKKCKAANREWGQSHFLFVLPSAAAAAAVTAIRKSLFFDVLPF